MTWQPSADQRRLIGHMVLHREHATATARGGGDLGLKVIGGRRTDSGRLGAFITRVKRGSAADTVGRLRTGIDIDAGCIFNEYIIVGDEVLEWNGIPLQNATNEQVYDIINASKNELQIELIVSRSMR